MTQLLVVLLISAVALAYPTETLAQRTTAMFSGIVTDPSGAVLPGAEVQLLNEGTGSAVQQVTNETGEFVFDFLPVGTYTLMISMRGFKKYENRGIPLGGAQIVRRSYMLEIGAWEENVSVLAEVPLVNAISTEQRISIETLEIKSLPMINRNITNILSVGSGLTTGRPTSDGMAGTRFRLNGLGGSAMGVTANGSDANGASGSPNISGYGGYNKIDVMSSESVAEVQVVKGVMPAEYGSVMAGMMSVITKSGTNDFHGSLFHRYEGSALSARNATLRRKPNSVWNQFGGSLGGPVKRDRLFFFAAYEGYRQRTTVPLEPTVPTPYFRNILQRYLPYAETRLFLEMYPLPNEPYGETDLLARWVGPGARINDDDHVDAKIDYLLGKGMLSLTFAYGHPYQSRPSSNPLDPQDFRTSAQRANLTYSTSWGGGRWTSSTRAGYNRNRADRVDQSWFLKDPNKQEQSLGGRRVPVITFPGMTSLRTEFQGRGLKPSWQADTQIGFFQGKHSWKFGGILNMPGGGRPGSNNPDARFQTLDDIMRNELQSISFETGKYPTTWRMYNFGFFVQDDWQISQKLVLNLGLRYDRYDNFVAKPWNEDQPALLPNFDGLLDSVNFIWGPLRPEDSPFNADPLSLSPRFGFAYTADDTGSFVIRGGFGVNFQGYDPQTYDVNVAKSIYLPNNKSWTRAEAAALGLRYPNLYLEDLIEIVRTEFQGRPQVGSRYDPNSKPPYAMNYTLGFQRELTKTLMLETAYVGSRGVKFNMARPYNQPDRITGIRPNRNDISGNYTDQSQQTNYNSWQTSLRQRLTSGLLFNVHYTWGRAMAYVGGDVAPSFLGDTFGGIEDFSEVKIEHSLSGGDITHQFVGNWVYTIPTPFAGSGLARHTLGGWQISGILRLNTGEPLGVSQTGGRPDLLDIKNAVNTQCCSFGNTMYLNRAAFQLVEVSRASNRTIRRGHMANRALRGPGSQTMDLSILKTITLTEGKRLELKADLVNALNHVNYSGISSNMSNVTFGQAVATDPARTIQVQARLSF